MSILASIALTALVAYGPGQIHQAPKARQPAASRSAPAAPVSGSIPRGLPARLLVGLFEDTGQTWMKDSGVPWDVRYRYFVKGWIDNWGYGPGNGQWGLRFLKECEAQGFLPAIQYYPKSFNRYAEWLRLWNVASGKRWVLWQIPLGNSNHLNVDNTRNAPREGYRDNHPEYFFGPGGAAHREKFARSGVIALLFGKGEGRQSSYTNDVYTDGQLFMKSRAGAFLKAGGLAIPATGSPSPGGGVTAPPPAAPLPAPLPAPAPPASQTAAFQFENGTQGWKSWGPLIQGVSASTTRAFAGSRSLEVKVAGVPKGMAKVYVPGASVPAGRTVSFRVWIPAGHRLSALQPFVLQGAAGGWKWSGAWVAATSLKAGTWNTVSLQVPAGAVSPFQELGLEIFTEASWKGSLYVDSVSW